MPGDFSISESPISDALTGAAAFGPSFTFSPENVKYRYGERYASEASNRKFLGVPLGVYLGFNPSFVDDILTLSADPDFGYNFARVASQDDSLYILDVVIENDSVLDFTNHASFPVNVILKVRGKLGFPHSAEIVTQTAAPVFPTEILIGVVTAPNTIDVAEPFNRDTPFAYSGAPLGYGFMGSGSVEDLLAAIALNAEVATARIDLSGFTHPSLDARLEADGDPAAVANRLGKEMKTILADDFALAGSTDTLNVSRAFSRFHRNITGNTPIQDFDGFASETRPGAITGGTVPEPTPLGALTDPERNVCAIIDATTESRLTSATRQVAYGRLVHDVLTLSGTDITFTNGLTAVAGTTTLFTTQVEAGDIIQDPVSGDFFEVNTITSDVLLDISVAFPNATTPGATAPALRRRFTLNARIRSGPDSDTAFTMPVGSIRVFFNAWLTVEAAQYDYSTDLLRAFEADPIISATTSASGKALVAATLSEGRAGAIFAVQQGAGNQVGPSHVHTIDFNGAASGGSGIIDVTQRGPGGLPGNPGGGGLPGPPGPQGLQGQGFTNFSTANLFRESNVFQNGILGSGVQYSYTTNMVGTEILFLTGGMSEWWSPFIFDADDHFQIDGIEIVSGVEVRLNARVPIGATPSAELKFYLNAATR